MVSRDVVLQTVKRMYSSGVDDDTVISTLKDIGISDEEIKSVIAEAKGIKQEQKPTPPPQPTGVAPKPAGAAAEAAEDIGEEYKGGAEEEGEEEYEETAGANKEEPAQERKESLLKEKPSYVSGNPLPPEQETIAKRAAEHVNENLKSAQDEAALRDNAIHATIEEHSEKLDKLSKGIAQIQKGGPGAIATDSSLNKKLNELQKDIGEVKAATSALQDLLKKILSTNRSILIRLEKKK